MPSEDILAELQWRGLVHQVTDPALGERLKAEPFTLYCGFDPSSDSLHVGNLLGLLNLRRFQRAGHKPLAVAGGGTGFVGDPSGKSAERSLLSAGQLEANLAGIRRDMERVLDFSPGGAELVNNADWLCKLSLIEFLRETGKHFTVNAMLDKESVRARLEDREHGISYTEFSYMLLQAYDFWHLYEHRQCRLQVGGSDQWGNITAGCELIRRVLAKEDAGTDHQAHGLTWPLLTRSDGKKFGKTEDGAIWLSPERTPPYAFYQYWINVPDGDVGRFLRFFTELPKEEIEALEKKHAQAPQKREAQRVLARQLTELIHGEAERRKAEQASVALFGSGSGPTAALQELDEAALLEVLKGAPSGTLAKTRLAGGGVPLLALMTESGLWKSRGDAKRSIQGGGASLNNERIGALEHHVTAADLLHGKYLVLRKGKKGYFLYRAE